jgi:hypothetical protein
MREKTRIVSVGRRGKGGRRREKTAPAVQIERGGGPPEANGVFRMGNNHLDLIE